MPKTTPATTASTILAEHEPFFLSAVRFIAPKGNYGCVFCGVLVTMIDDVGLSYAQNRGSWTHAAP